MKPLKNILAHVWFALVSVISPVWIGIIFMDITGHSKGYSYDLGAETGISVFFGGIELFLWIISFVPITIYLCKKYYRYKKSFIWLPFVFFVLLFILGVSIIGWKEFIYTFGF